MAYNGVLKEFKACVELRRPSRMPVFALGLEFNARMCGLSYGENRRNVDKTVRCEVEAVREYDYDWAIIFPDDYIEFEPLGLLMHDDEDHPTMPSEYLPMNRQTLRGLRIADMRNAMRCPIHLEMLRKTKEALGDTALVMGRIAAPFSAVGLVYGIEELMVNMLTEPDLVRDNVRFFIDHQIAFGKAQLEAGADLLWLGDCCASSKFMRAEHFSEFAFDGAARVAEALTGLGGLLIYHTNETAIPHLRAQVQLPVSAVNVGEGVSISKIKRELNPKKCLMGNLDPLILRDGTSDEVAGETERVIRQSMPGGGYIFNTGEGVMATTPSENVKAMMRVVRALSETLDDLMWDQG